MQRPAPVYRLHPRGRRHGEALQTTLDLGGWSEPTRIELNGRLTVQSYEPETWSFVMLAARADLNAAFNEAIKGTKRPLATLLVWHALSPYVRRDTGEVLCTQKTLARTARVSPGEITDAMNGLVEMGALERFGHGKYRVHPVLMWKGELAKRERAEASAPALRLVPA